MSVTVVLRNIEKLHAHDLRWGDSSEPPVAGAPKRTALWKLYPWEWIIHESLGSAFTPPPNSSPYSSPWQRPAEAPSAVQTYEPAWKLLASSKARTLTLTPTPTQLQPQPQPQPQPYNPNPNSKAMLAYLWAKHPGHPNLLPAAMADDLLPEASRELAKDWVSKPALGREGHGLLYGDEAPLGPGDAPDGSAQLAAFASSVAQADANPTLLPRAPPPIEIPANAAESLAGGLGALQKLAEAQATSAGQHASHLMDRGGLTKPASEQDRTVQVHVGPSVMQRYHALPSLMGRKVVTSCWVVRGLPVAACFREDTDRTTNNNSCFVPHWVEPSTPSHGTAAVGGPSLVDPGRVGSAERLRADCESPGAADAVAEAPCCPHREFGLTRNQRRLRTARHRRAPCALGPRRLARLLAHGGLCPRGRLPDGVCRLRCGPLPVHLWPSRVEPAAAAPVPVGPRALRLLRRRHGRPLLHHRPHPRRHRRSLLEQPPLLGRRRVHRLHRSAHRLPPADG